MTASPPPPPGTSAADPEERRRAVARMAAQNDPDSASWVVQLMGDTDWRVRKEATSVALKRAPDPVLLAELVNVLFDDGGNVGLRNAVAEALGGYGRSAIDAVTRAWSKLDPGGRKLAVEALAHTGEDAAATLLVSAFSDPDANVRAAAIESVAELNPTMIDEIVPHFEEALGDTDPYQKLVVLESMNQLNIPVGFEQLKPLLDDPLLRKAALVAAGRTGDPTAAKAVSPALEQATPSIYAAALGAGADLAVASEDALAALRYGLTLSEAAKARLLKAAGDETAPIEQQRHALLVCGAMGTPEATRVVVSRIGDEAVGRAAEQALTMLGGEATAALAEAVMDERRSDRAICVELLGRVTDSKDSLVALDAIRSAMRSEESDIVRAGLLALARLGDATALADAAYWFKGRFPAQLRFAARAALVTCAQRYPAAARELAHTIPPDGPLAGAAALIVAAIDGPVFETEDKDVQFLTVAVSNPDPVARAAALEALSCAHGPDALAAIAFALNDEAQEVQFAALRALGAFRNEEGKAAATQHLVLFLKDATDDGLRVVAIESLGETRDAEAREVLQSYVTEENARIAVAAVEVLAQLEAPGAAVSRALEHPDAEVVKAALRVFDRSPDETVPEELLACLHHDAWDVRRLSADVLGRVGGERAVHLLTARLAEEREPLVIDAIRRSLAAIHGVRPSLIAPGGGVIR